MNNQRSSKLGLTQTNVPITFVAPPDSLCLPPSHARSYSLPVDEIAGQGERAPVAVEANVNEIVLSFPLWFELEMSFLVSAIQVQVGG